jgi:spermidine synthase
MAATLGKSTSDLSAAGTIRPESNLSWYFAFFIVSGFCGLVYEVVWLRLAMASFGVTTALTSIVLSAFMAGLGLGSWGAGALTRRVLDTNGPRALRIYSIAELLVGVSSFAVPFELRLGRQILLHLNSFGGWQSSGYYVAAGIWIAFALVPWCVCMGSTFPLLMAVIRKTNRAASERSFSYLYLANVLGALIGTLASAFIIIELMGFRGTLFVAGCLNAILAIAALTLSFRVDTSVFQVTRVETPPTRPRLYGLPDGCVLLFLFTTGMVSMGMEIIWIRQLTPYLGNVVYAFAGIVAVYLLSSAVGTEDYRKWRQRHSPGESASTWIFLALAAAIPAVAGTPSAFLAMTSLEIVRLCTIILFCTLAGFLTPLLVDSWSNGDPDRAGTAYAYNIAGCIAGPLIAGFGLLPWMSERWAILILDVPLFAIAAATIFGSRTASAVKVSLTGPAVKLALAGVAAVLLFSFSQDYETMWPQRIVKRDYTATVIATGSGFSKSLLVNGIGMTVLTPITKGMVHLPLALLPRPPKNGLVICFGMGTSFRSMLSWGIPTTAVDLVPSVPELIGYYQPHAQELVASPLAHIVVDDGRRFLDGSSETYDAIIVDPPPPVQAPGSSLLYSREFYSVIKAHLQQDGILQIWYPASFGDTATLASIAKSLIQSFPYVRAFEAKDDRFEGYGFLFLASKEPIPVTSSGVLATRLPAAAAADLVEWGPKPTPQQQFDWLLSRERDVNRIAGEDTKIPALTDDRPINEYFLLRDWFHISR